tara:strand:+ start:2684 stop:2953 length:270 start_codon:yes stop_codon:yes gene_type:complete
LKKTNAENVGSYGIANIILATYVLMGRWKMTKEPKDLGIKIGTKSQVLWTNVLKESEMLIQQSKDNLEIQEEMRKLAKSKIKKEKQKLK